MSNARTVFEGFLQGGLEAIEQTVQNKQEETLYLDFKQASCGRQRANGR